MPNQDRAFRSDRPEKPVALVDMIQLMYTDHFQSLELAGDIEQKWITKLPRWLIEGFERKPGSIGEPDTNVNDDIGEALIQLDPRLSADQSGVALETVGLMSGLSDDPETCRSRMGRLHLLFKGLPLGRRSHEIPEVRNHFRSVNLIWPYWFHFLAPTLNNYATITALLCHPIDQKIVAGRVQVRVDLDEIYFQIQRLVQASLILQGIHHVPLASQRNHSRQVISVLKQCILAA